MILVYMTLFQRHEYELLHVHVVTTICVVKMSCIILRCALSAYGKASFCDVVLSWLETLELLRHLPAADFRMCPRCRPSWSKQRLPRLNTLVHDVF